MAGNRAVRDYLTGPLTVQRFESGEHLRLGDRGVGRSQAQMVNLTPDYQVTYGEMIAMAGDYFQDLAQMREIAANEGSREQIEYVRVVRVHGETGRKNEFSETARKEADLRYSRLALSNESHFVNPEGQPGTTEDRAEGAHPELRLEWRGLLPGFASRLVAPRAGAAYRHYHLEALFLAYVAGFTGSGMQDALAPEAFGAHFLTDAFSSGHLRTPRLSIQEYWNPRVPMFGHNLAGFIAQTLALRIGDAEWTTSREMAYSGFLIWSGTLEEVSAKLAEKGVLGFGDVVSGVLHDRDSDRGVQAMVEGRRVRLFGDKKLGGETERLAMDAVDYSHNDLTRAWLAGRRRAPLQEVLPEVTEGKLLGAEHMLPEAVAESELPDEDKQVDWQLTSAEALLEDPKFQQGLTVFGANKAEELAEIEETLPPVAKPHFRPGVVEPFRANPLAVLRRVLHWTPDTGGGALGHNQDDNALDYYNEACAKKAVDTLTVQQRVKLIRDLLDGYTADDEEDAAFHILTAKPADSREVISDIGWPELEDELGSRFSRRFPESDYR
jgi:hypothetical protein